MDNSPESPTNVELIYEYTKHSYELARQNTAQLNIRLTAVLAAAGLLLRLTADITNKSQLGVSLHLAGGGFAVLSLASCVFALNTRVKGTGGVVKTQYLMEEWYRDKTDEECRCLIVNTWAEAIDKIDKLASRKAFWLNAGLQLLSCAGVMLAVEVAYKVIAVSPVKSAM